MIKRCNFYKKIRELVSKLLQCFITTKSLKNSFCIFL